VKKTIFKKQKSVFIFTLADKEYFQVINPLGEVTVALSKERKKRSLYCVSVWGDDDIGMIFRTGDVDIAIKTYLSIHNGITRKKLLLKGFSQV